MKVLGNVMWSATILCLALSMEVARVEAVNWNGHNLVNLDWDTTTANWGAGVAFTNGDTANFINHGQGVRQTLVIDAGGVSPGAITMAYWGGENGSYEFSGGDITGTGTFSMTSDGVLHLPRSFSFSGGSSLTHISTNLQMDPTSGGTYHFGTGDITLNAAWKVGSAQFRFLPTVAATNDNNFVVLGGGGSIQGNANASWSSNVALQGVVGLTGDEIWNGMTFNLSDNNGGIEFFRSGSGSLPKFDGNVQGAAYDVTFGDGSTSGTPTDYEIVIDPDSTWNVNNLILDSNRTSVLVEGTDSQTVFDDVNGKIILQSNTILATDQGSTGNYTTYGGTYYVENDYELHDGTYTRIVADNILVQDDGSVSGDGLLHAHNGVTVNDGTLAPGFSAGTLQVDGNLTLTSSSMLDFELGTSGTNDMITVDGDLVLDGTMNLSLLESLQLDTPYNYTLFTYTGSITDSTLDLVLPEGFQGSLDLSTTGVVALNMIAPVPEPSTLLLLLVGLVGIRFGRKRRST